MAVSKWATAKTERTPAQALGELARMPSAGHASLVNPPFPMIHRDEYLPGVKTETLNDAIDKAPIVDVPLNRLRSIQSTVSRERVQSFIKNPKQLKRGTTDPWHGGPTDVPVVVQKGEHMFLHDGHHRATAAKLLGQQTIKARLVRIPATPGWGTGNPGSLVASGSVSSST